MVKAHLMKISEANFFWGGRGIRQRSYLDLDDGFEVFVQENMFFVNGVVLDYKIEDTMIWKYSDTKH
jgi:hypothetical protein